MRQRLAIARSLLVNNPLLFLDEPTVKLDAPGARSIRDFIGQINKEFGVTIILTTHLIDEAELLCGRVAIMERGKIISCDSVSHLRDNLGWKNSCTMVCSSIPAEETKSKLISHLKEVSGAAKYSFIGETLLLENSVDSSLSFEAQKILRREGINILSIQWNEPRLEEVFLTTLKKGGRTLIKFLKAALSFFHLEARALSFYPVNGLLRVIQSFVGVGIWFFLSLFLKDYAAPSPYGIWGRLYGLHDYRGSLFSKYRYHAGSYHGELE
jgi:energy-coupling factor transporter ATP-binding protein EcfA2